MRGARLPLLNAVQVPTCLREAADDPVRVPHAVANEGEREREVSTEWQHRGGDVATVANDPPEEQHVLSNGALLRA